MRLRKEDTQLTDDTASFLFGGSAESLDGDCSLAAFLRATVVKYGGLGMDELAEAVVIRRVRLSGSDVDDVEGAIVSAQAPILIIEASDTMLDNLKDFKLDGWKTYESGRFLLNFYLSQFNKCKVYVNEDMHRITAIVLNRPSHLWTQAFISVMAKVMTWYFPAELPDATKNFFKAISGFRTAEEIKSAEKTLIDYAEDAAKMIDFRSVRLHKMLDGVADKVRRMQIEALTSSAKDTEDYIRRYLIDLSRYYADFDRITVELNALRNSPKASDDTMLRFFDQHKNITLLSVDGTTLTYGVEGTLEYYDQDEWEANLSNTDSFLHDYFSKETLRYFSAIFTERIGIIRVNAEFELASMKLVRPIRGRTFISNAAPNPHIFYHACSGNNDKYYSEYADKGEWELAIEQSIGATMNLNMGDSTVCREFIEWFDCNEGTPCIYVNEDGTKVEKITPDTKLVSFKEFKALVDKVSAKPESEKTDG